MGNWKNPFDLLNASPADGRLKLAALAQDAALLVGEAEAQKAYSELLNPETRLKAEIRWAGGDDNSLSRLNRLVWTLDSQKISASRTSKTADVLQELCASFHAADAQTVAEIINEARESAKIIKATENEVQEALDAYAREVARGIAQMIHTAQELGLVIRQLAKRSRSAGQENLAYSLLLSHLAAEYEIGVAAEMTREREGITEQVELLKSDKPMRLDVQMTKLCKHIARWNTLALPLRSLNAARGLQHEPSNKCFWEAREPLDRLFNKQRIAKVSYQLVRQLRDCFSDVEELQETIQNDYKIVGDWYKMARKSTEQNNQSMKRSALGLVSILVVMVLFNLFTGGYVKEESPGYSSVNTFNREMEKYQREIETHQEALANIYRSQMPRLKKQIAECKEQMAETMERYKADPNPITMALYKKLEASCAELEETRRQKQAYIDKMSPDTAEEVSSYQQAID